MVPLAPLPDSPLAPFPDMVDRTQQQRVRTKTGGPGGAGRDAESEAYTCGELVARGQRRKHREGKERAKEAPQGLRQFEFVGPSSHDGAIERSEYNDLMLRQRFLGPAGHPAAWADGCAGLNNGVEMVD